MATINFMSKKKHCTVFVVNGKRVSFYGNFQFGNVTWNSEYVLPDLSLLLMAAWKQEEEEKIKLQRVVRELLGQKARLEIWST